MPGWMPFARLRSTPKEWSPRRFTPLLEKLEARDCPSALLAQNDPGFTPVGWWKLNDGSCSMAADASGNSHAGNLVSNAFWATDAPSATGFAGSLGLHGGPDNSYSDQVSVPYSSDWALPATEDWSISLWVKFNQVGNAIFLAHDSGQGEVAKWDLGYWGGTLNFHINGPGCNPGGQYPIAMNWSPATGTWYQIAVNRSGNSFQLFVNGSLAQTGFDSHPFPTPAQLASAPLTMGQGENLFYLNGALSDVRIGRAGSLSTPEDTPLTIPVANLLANDAIPQGTTIAGYSQGTNGTVSFNGTHFLYTPSTNFHGTDQFTYTLDDGQGHTSTATVAVNVTPVNDAPTADGTTLSTIQDTAVDVDLRSLANDVETAAANLSFTVGGASHGSVILVDGHTARFTPANSYQGEASFTFSVTDTGDGSSLALTTGPTTVNVAVQRGPNHAPVALDDPNPTPTAWWNLDNGSSTDVPANLGTGHSAYFNGYTDVLSFADSPAFTLGGGAFTISLWAKFASTGNNVLLGHDEGGGNTNKWVFYYSAGQLIFHLNFINGGGGVNPLTVNWSPGNQWHHLAVTRDGTTWKLFIDQTLAQTGNSSNSVPDPSAALTLGMAEGIFPFAGNLDDVRIYKSALADNQVAGLYRNVLDPSAANFSTVQDTALTLSSASLLANDWDVDGDPLTITGTSQGYHGMVTLSGTQITYVPEAGFHGTDTFTYTIADGQGGNATATVSVTVQQVPTLTLNLVYGANHEVTLTGQVSAENPAGLTVTFTGVLTGTAVTAGNGSFSITGTCSSLGTISATVTDSHSLTSSPVSVTVANTAPVIQNFQGVFTGVNNLWTFSGQVLDEFSPGLTVLLGTLPSLANVQVTVDIDGWFSYTVQLPANEEGFASAQVTDWWGSTSTTVFTLI